MDESWLNILLSIAISLVSSFLWWLLTQITSWGARKRINSYLIRMRDINFNFEKYIQYNDYDLALAHSQSMRDLVGEIYLSIKPLTYCCKKKKLILTLLNSLSFTLSNFLRIGEGYDSFESEKESCCGKMILEIHSYGVIAGISKNSLLVSSLSAQIELLSDLNLGNNDVAKILLDFDDFNIVNIDLEPRKNLLKSLINVYAFKDSFPDSVYKRFALTTQSLTIAEYEKIIANMEKNT